VDLIGGQTDIVVDQLTGSASYIQAGTLRALAVMSRDRDSALPAIATLRESGLKDFEAMTSTGLLVPAGTPPAVVDTLNRALRQALADERVVARLLAVGGVAHASSPREFSQMLQSEDGRAQILANAGKLKAD
jgi:tripartite-type tricarboxylate transporter receptor subunit TctC